MSRIDDVSPELRALLAAVCDDTAAQDDLARLEQLVGDDENAINLILDYVQVHYDLRFQLAGQKALSDVMDKMQGTRGGQRRPLIGMPPEGPPSPWGFLGALGRQGWGFFSDHTLLFSVLVGLVVVGLLAAVTGPGILSFRPAEVAHAPAAKHRPQAAGLNAVPIPKSNPKSPIPNPSPVARLARMTDCRWASPKAALAPGSKLLAGQWIDIASGRAEITFGHDAAVLLDGPGLLTVQSGRSAKLVRGSLVAKASRGFTVSTPAAAVVGLGGEFCVRVDPDGFSEVCTATGAVEVRAGGAAIGRRLDCGQAAQIDPNQRGSCALVENGDDTMAFRFFTIEPPHKRGGRADAPQGPGNICVVQCKPAVRGGSAESPSGSREQSQVAFAEDSPAKIISVSDDDAKTAKIMVDLLKNVRVVKVNTYSWRRDEKVAPGDDARRPRAPQHYMLYGFSGDTPPPTAGDPAQNGWTRISSVDTSRFFVAPSPTGLRPAQQAVSIAGAQGDLGRWRFLLWRVWGMSARASLQNAAPGKHADNNNIPYDYALICDLDVYWRGD